uniref:DNA-repair protein Xrcc1 N-terminal domain-containing protein n=1 Tax=Timema tahoe TaxID=61484 RepID=A0A7R9IJX4_9NEOP|nr:unnamed protein product [Timema tahoe]
MPALKLVNVVNVSSQDPRYPAKNLMKEEKWLSAPACKVSTIEAIFLFNQAAVISSLDIGNHGSAFVAVMVCKTGSNEFKDLLPQVSLMSVTDSRTGKNKNVVRMLKKEDLCSDTRDEKWALVKLVCSQPFNMLAQFGLSFVRFHSLAEECQEEVKHTTQELMTFKKQHLISLRQVLSATETTRSANAAPFRLLPHPTNTTNVSFPPPPSSNFGTCFCCQLNEFILWILVLSRSHLLGGDSKMSRKDRLALELCKSIPLDEPEDVTTEKIEPVQEEEESLFKAKAISYLDSLNLHYRNLKSIKTGDVRRNFEKSQDRNFSLKEQSDFVDILKNYVKNLNRRDSYADTLSTPVKESCGNDCDISPSILNTKSWDKRRSYSSDNVGTPSSSTSSNGDYSSLGRIKICSSNRNSLLEGNKKLIEKHSDTQDSNERLSVLSPTVRRNILSLEDTDKKREGKFSNLRTNKCDSSSPNKKVDLKRKYLPATSVTCTTPKLMLVDLTENEMTNGATEDGDFVECPICNVDEEAAVHVPPAAASAEDPDNPPPVDANSQPGPSMEPQPVPSIAPLSAPLTFTWLCDEETWQRLAPDCMYEEYIEYIAADDDITVWSTLNAADIIREQQESSDEKGEEEMEEEPEDIPTTKDVLKAGDIYSRAFKCQGAREVLWSQFYNVKEFSEKTGTKKKQASIMDFFKK